MGSHEPALPKPAPPRLAPLLGPTAAASMLVGAACVAGVLDVWAVWNRYSVGVDYVTGMPGIWVADLTSANATGDAVSLVYLITMVSAGIALLVWLGRVRANARLLVGMSPPRPGLALAGWFACTAFALVVTVLLGEVSWVADLRVLAVTDTVSVALQCAVGAVVVVVVRRITRAQQAPSQPV